MMLLLNCKQWYFNFFDVIIPNCLTLVSNTSSLLKLLKLSLQNFTQLKMNHQNESSDSEQDPLIILRMAEGGTPIRRMWMGLRRSSFLLTIYIIFYVTFLMLGAVVFGAMEGPLEEQSRLEIRSRIDNFRAKHPSISGLTSSQAILFIRRFFQAPLQNNLSFNLSEEMVKLNWKLIEPTA